MYYFIVAVVVLLLHGFNVPWVRQLKVNELHIVQSDLFRVLIAN